MSTVMSTCKFNFSGRHRYPSLSRIYKLVLLFKFFKKETSLFLFLVFLFKFVFLQVMNSINLFCISIRVLLILFLKRNKLANDFLEWKLRKLLLLYRILFKQCEKLISKRLLLQLISLQILQITSSNENKNDQNYEEQQQKNKIINKTLIEMQNKLIEFIISNKNSNLNSKTKNQTKLVSFLKNLNKSTNS